MENLNLGLEFGVFMLLLWGIVYYFIAILNYQLTIFLGGQIKKLSDRIIAKGKKNLITTALPFIIAATVIFLIIINPVLSSVNGANSLYSIPGGILFWNPFFYYLTGFSGYITGLSCLSLTRYSFSTDWTVIGILKNRSTFLNFILWTAMSIMLTFICKQSSFFWLLYLVSTIVTTYLFLKWRNVNKPTRNTYSK